MHEAGDFVYTRSMNLTNKPAAAGKAKHLVSRSCVLTPPLPWDKPIINESVDEVKNDEVVILLHGLWRSVRAMQPLALHLNEEGYMTVNLPYASFRYDLDNLAQSIIKEIQPYLDKGHKIHIVTHSLGGVVAKKLVDLLDEEAFSQIGRVVMLAPPHQGSEIVDWLGKSTMRPLKGLLGPAGKFLSTENMAKQGDVLRQGLDAAVIMGKKSSLPFFRTLLNISNDGIVSVDKGKLSGTQCFRVVDADHTFIANDSVVMNMVRSYIETGKM